MTGAAGVVPLFLLACVAEGELALCCLTNGDAPLQVLVDHPVHGEADKAIDEDGWADQVVAPRLVPGVAHCHWLIL